MTIWIDADSCPAPVRDVVARACKRTEIRGIYVANREIPLPPRNELIEMQVSGTEEGSADDIIVNSIQPGDLAVTRDIPLADRLLKKEARVVNDRGEEFTSENIGPRLYQRNYMMELRLNGVIVPEKKGSYGKRELHAFSSAFDRVLNSLLRSSH